MSPISFICSPNCESRKQKNKQSMDTSLFPISFRSRVLPLRLFIACFRFPYRSRFAQSGEHINGSARLFPIIHYSNMMNEWMDDLLLLVPPLLLLVLLGLLLLPELPLFESVHVGALLLFDHSLRRSSLRAVFRVRAVSANNNKVSENQRITAWILMIA